MARDYADLVEDILTLHRDSVAGAATAVNRALVLRNWLIGAHIVEFEQKGSDRAAYGEGLLRRLSSDLSSRGFKGSSPDMLERMRLLFRHYPQLATRNSAPAVRNSTTLAMARDTFLAVPSARESAGNGPTPLGAAMVLRLSWSHLATLVRIDDPWKRAFYENECLKGNWSKRQLQRQIDSLLFERTGLSKNKLAVVQAGRRQANESRQSLADLIRDPYVLEFTGLAEQPRYRESDLEGALLNHLQNYWKANELEVGDSPPVGLLLCSDRSATRVEYATTGLDHQMFVSRYLVALPSPDQLREFVEADRAALESAVSEPSVWYGRDGNWRETPYAAHSTDRRTTTACRADARHR